MHPHLDDSPLDSTVSFILPGLFQCLGAICRANFAPHTVLKMMRKLQFCPLGLYSDNLHCPFIKPVLYVALAVMNHILIRTMPFGSSA